MDRNKIITVLCGSNINSEDYTSCEGYLCDKCQNDMYCDMQHLSDGQVKYIISDVHSDIYLNACPGSGKTEVIGVKCAYEMSLWEKTEGGLAILTFTNSAENELRERVAAYYKSQPDYPHFLGTFTSWIHGYIANPFLYLITGHGNAGKEDAKLQIIDTDCNSGFLNAFKTKYSYGNLHKLSANEFFFGSKEKRYQYCGKSKNGEVDFDKALSEITYMNEELKRTKQKFWKAGFFLYEDVEILTFKLLKKQPEIANLIAKRFPLIIVDECQDLSHIQLLILGLLHKSGSIIHLIGDLDQAIYGFRGIEPIDTSNFIKGNHFKEMILDENYRSNQAIVDISGTIIKRNNSVFGKIQQKVSKPLIAFLYRQNQENLLINQYRTILTENNLKSQECRIIVRNDTLRARLRGAKNVSEYNSINIIEDYAHFIYLHNEHTVREFQESIRILARAIQKSFFSDSKHENIINLYRPIEIENSDWQEIILLFQKMLLSDDEVLDLSPKWGNWKVSLNKCLLRISHKLLGKFELKRLRNNIKDKLVIKTFEASNTSIENNDLLVETIHSCKGMSLQSVLFVSAYNQSSNASGSYWKDWFVNEGETIGEAQRLAYVAFSRAKHLLAVGIPNPKSSPISTKEIEMLKEMGFYLFDCESNNWLE